MGQNHFAFFDYLEERSINAVLKPGNRRKKVQAEEDPFGSSPDIYNWQPSLYAQHLGYYLEKRESVPETEGIWIQTGFRIQRHSGDPKLEDWPYETRLEAPPLDLNSPKKGVRNHHYFRIFTAEECRRISQIGHGFSLDTKRGREP